MSAQTPETGTELPPPETETIHTRRVACDGGEGALGLVRGFLYAGARQVIATAWQVADRSSFEFSQRLFAGAGGAQADWAASLRVAQIRTLRDNPATRHPYYWAGYSITGSPP